MMAGAPRQADDTAAPSRSQFARETSWFGDLEAGTEGRRTRPREGTHPTPTEPGTTRPTFERIYQAFLVARLVLGMLGLLLLATLWGTGVRVPTWVSLLGAGYATLTALAWLWPGHHRQRERERLGTRQALSTVGGDLALFALLHHITGSGVNAQALLVLPVLMAAVLLPRILALGVAATATLNLLSVAWLQGGRGDDMAALMTQAGLNGLGLFLIAGLASELSARLAREERSARGNMEAARRQAQLNKLVIDEMSEGVLVVDRRGRVRTAKPSARRL